ncbi:response regulator transcription factor [Ochrovirga pacifica]|uniref:hypothetical protein n=1 Tax=Ochrovirga pacifica TaxID=1042376 RepID=UPI000255A520|nr:hypothetical protein [Ochrovirga pacifica]
MKRCLCVFTVLAFFTAKVLGNDNLKKVTFLDKEKRFLVQEQIDSLQIKTNDTLLLIDDYIQKSDEYLDKEMYAMAYDFLWKALELATATNDKRKLAVIYYELGVLYGIYRKEGEAIEYKKKALTLIKQDSTQNRIRKLNKLSKNYYGLAVQYRKARQYRISEKYLDSCTYIQQIHPNKNKENPFVYAERGKLFLEQKKLNEAEPLLLKAKDLFEQRNMNYLVIVYSFLGDLYTEKKEISKAIMYYEKSLYTVNKVKTHGDLKTHVLQKIAALYKQQNQLRKAYAYLETSSKIIDSLFDMRNIKNDELFEIKNKYEENLLVKDAHIQEQERIIEKKKRLQLQLILVIGFILLSLIGLLFLFYHKAKVKRLQVEKENAAINIKHKQEKLNAVVETKSKELTVSALQLIEKDKNIDKLLDLLKEKAPETYRKVQKEIVRGNKDLWESFNLRFTEVNTDFYKRLREKHSTLTPTEQKHCALIKLKFDSKEMARLLNISVNSVHISRHRIRKKIGLQRDEDLSNYIGNI